MKKNILIFRSASYDIICRLINYILEKYDSESIYIIIQKEAIELLRIKYPNIKYIINENGFFKYNNYLENINLRNNVECREYQEIYIPSSTIEINNFQEIQAIISKISKKNVFFYNCLGEVTKVNTNIFYIKISEKLKKLSESLLNVLLLLVLKIIKFSCLVVSRLKMDTKEGDLNDR
ncbi:MULTISPECIES: hypothetical protein [unclassified Clostridium]|uniref:hypothetical protein n=1 Tax=unclassified Clostridium TaxID=2614128 RepID=UPI0002975BAE|nr:MULTISPECIES: hypothetical protein [unclassified Clostridium]EKQ51114.1 MAG: hypothetical protein A370_05141 [Clostridium sp. Maddingley MBC34-26]